LSGNVTIKIDDVKGFQPTLSWVQMGSSITFVNTGRNVHGVKGLYPFNVWWGPFVGDGYTLYPGDTYQWNTPGSAGAAPHTSEPAGKSFTQGISSVTPNDLVPPESSGRFDSFRGVCLGASRFDCGTSGMTGTIVLVAPPS